MLTSKSIARIAMLLCGVGACHHAPPAVTPAPVQASAPKRTAELVTNDSVARSRARADSMRLAREASERAVAVARAALVKAVYFDFDSASIRDDQRVALDSKVPVLRQSPELRIRVEGNTDERGSEEYNIALGMRRAATAKRFLTEHGIDANRIDVASFGEERPACTTSEESCWQQNRRDEFRITAGEVRPIAP